MANKKRKCYVNTSIGENIKKLRKQKGLTQKELGIALGFNPKSADVRIAQYEASARTPKMELITQFAEFFSVPTIFLSHPTALEVMEFFDDLLSEAMTIKYPDGRKENIMDSLLDKLNEKPLKEFEISITETLQMIVTVEAQSAEEAESIVRSQYNDADYIIDAEHFKGVEFSVKSDNDLQKGEKSKNPER